MADDSNLLEFTLHDDGSDQSISESAAPNVLSKQASPSVDNEIKSRIDAIIANITRNTLPKSALALITNYWKPLLIKSSSEQGLDSLSWRDDIKKLTNLSLYLDPETSKQYPQISTKLLPDLLNEMRQHLTDNQLADDSLHALVRAVQNNSNDVPTEVAEQTVQQKPTPAEPLAKPITSESMDNVESIDERENTSAFDVSEQVDIAEFEIDENDSFDFDLAEGDVDSQSEQIDILEFELPEESGSAGSDFVESQQDPVPHADAKPVKSIEIDDLPPLDLEPFKSDN